MKRYLIFMLNVLTLVSLSVLTFASCADDYLEPEGYIVERNIQLSPEAIGIEIADGMQLVLDDKIPTGQAIVRTHENIQSHILKKVVQGRIIFEMDTRRFRNINVTITLSPLSYNNFIASGGSKINMSSQLVLPKAAFTVSGGSSASVACECNDVTIDCSGGSSITCSGRCDHIIIDCSGGSRIYGYDFPTKTAEVNVSGGSHIEINVTESLTGENSGGSRIYYKGDPHFLIINNNGGSATIPSKK